MVIYKTLNPPHITVCSTGVGTLLHHSYCMVAARMVHGLLPLSWLLLPSQHLGLIFWDSMQKAVLKVRQRKRGPEMGCKNMRQQRTGRQEPMCGQKLRSLKILALVFKAELQNRGPVCVCVRTCVWVCCVLVRKNYMRKTIMNKISNFFEHNLKCYSSP